MNLKFFGEWFNRKYPLNIEKNPEYHFDDKIWQKIPEETRSEIIENCSKLRIGGISIMFWLFVSVLFFGLLITAVF